MIVVAIMAVIVAMGIPPLMQSMRPESMRKAVADLGIAHEASTTRPYVTVSMGVATVDPGGEYSHEQTVRLADVALYASKARGRDGWSFPEPVAETVAAPAAEAAELLKTAS